MNRKYLKLATFTRVGVESGFTGAGGIAGYAATGTMEGVLTGASIGQAMGSAVGNLLVACFSAGTPLVVDFDGSSRAIDEIEVSDLVLAGNEFDPNGPLELKRVEEKFVRVLSEVFKLPRFGNVRLDTYFWANSCDFAELFEDFIRSATSTEQNWCVWIDVFGFSGEVWCELVKEFGRLFMTVAGKPREIDSRRSRNGKHRYKATPKVRELLKA